MMQHEQMERDRYCVGSESRQCAVWSHWPVRRDPEEKFGKRRLKHPGMSLRL